MTCCSINIQCLYVCVNLDSLQRYLVHEFMLPMYLYIGYCSFTMCTSHLTSALGLRQLCSKFCWLFYSALSKKCSNNSFWFILSKKSTKELDHSWAWASFTWVHPRIRFYLTCVGTKNCTVTANTKITTSASLSTARLYHPVTCSGRYLEKPHNVALFPCFPPFNSA